MSVLGRVTSYEKRLLSLEVAPGRFGLKISMLCRRETGRLKNLLIDHGIIGMKVDSRISK